MPYVAAQLFDNGHQRSVTIYTGPAGADVTDLFADRLADLTSFLRAVTRWAKGHPSGQQRSLFHLPEEVPHDR